MKLSAFCAAALLLSAAACATAEPPPAPADQDPIRVGAFGELTLDDARPQPAGPSAWIYPRTPETIAGLRRYGGLVNQADDERLAVLLVRKDIRLGLHVLLSFDRAVRCGDLVGQSVSVQFDEHKPESVACAEPEDGSQRTIALQPTVPIVNRMTKSTQMTVVIVTNRQERTRYTFDIEGLDLRSIWI